MVFWAVVIDDMKSEDGKGKKLSVGGDGGGDGGGDAVVMMKTK